jgi:hypothetical protein
MKVKDLIKALENCDQEKPVFVWEDHDIMDIQMIDELSDRVDLNIIWEDRDLELKRLIMKTGQFSTQYEAKK